jgi:hypothetical protein
VGSISIKFKKEVKPCLVVVVSDIFKQRPVFSEELIMALETATYIDGLVVTNPAATDGLAESDNHHRLVKSTLKATFPNITGAITATHNEVNVLDGITSTTAELNILDGVTATTAEINKLDGVTATALEINKLDGCTATAAELSLVSGVTSNIQSQFSTLNTSVSSLSTSVSNVNTYPMDVRVLTGTSTYTVPAGAKAILIKASGGGGGGSYHIYPTSGGNGGTGGTTYVTNAALGIAVVATGGGGGRYSGAGVSPFVGGSSGGDIQLGAGAAGGDSYKANWDISAHGGRSGNQVTKYVKSSSVGGRAISISYGAGGSAASSASAGAGGFVEIWVW